MQDYCALVFPAKQGLQVNNVTGITDGWECQIYSFDVEHGPTGERRRDGLILRGYSGDDACAWAEEEFHGMRRLCEVGYPVPRVLLLECENTPFGQPFVIMERIEGKVLWGPLVDSPEGKQQELLTLFCGLLVQLHRLDWRPFVDDIARYETQSPYAFVDAWLEDAWGSLEDSLASDWSPIVDWLRERRDEVPCRQPAVVHGDFHPLNVLLRENGSAAVIDWSGLCVTDARFDVANTLIVMDAYEGRDWRWRILHEYEHLAGARVEQIEWFEVYVSALWLYDVVCYLSGSARDWDPQPHAAATIKGNVKAHWRVYDRLVERTGIRVAEVEELLASLTTSTSDQG